MAVILFNRSPQTGQITAFWNNILTHTGNLFTVGVIGIATGRKCKVRDLWRHEDLGVFVDSFTATVESHGVVMVRVSPLP